MVFHSSIYRNQSLLASLRGLLAISLLVSTSGPSGTLLRVARYFFLEESMYLQRKSMPRMILSWMPRIAQTQASVRVSLWILMKSLMINISPKTPTGYSIRKELYLRNPVIGLLLKRQQRYRLTSAIDQIITTMAKRSLLLCSDMKIRVTMFLPKIWKKDPTTLPLLLPNRISTISRDWKICTARSTHKSQLMSDYRQESRSTKRRMPVPSSKQAQPARLTTLMIFSIYILISYSDQMRTSIKNESLPVGLAALAEPVADELLLEFVEELHVTQHEFVQLHLPTCSIIVFGEEGP